MTYVSSQAAAGRGTQLNMGSALVSPTYTTLAEQIKVGMSGSKLDIEDVTNMESGIFREKLATLLDSGEISFEGNYIATDATQAALLTAYNTAALLPWQIVLPGTLGTWSFLAYVGSVDFDIQVDKKMTISGKLTITGARTFAGG